KSIDIPIQIEWENQNFLGDRTFLEKEQGYSIESRSDLVRDSRSAALVTRWIAEGESPALRNLEVEVSGRLDRIGTRRLEQSSSYLVDENGQMQGEVLQKEKESSRESEAFWSKRLGLRAEGFSPRFKYVLFLGQGGNRRLPTLNDLFVKAHTNVRSYREAPLVPEIMNSTEVNVQLSFTDFVTIPTISELSVSGAYFRNNYDNKIGYVEVINEPPVPYNESQADISGFEGGMIASFFDRTVRFQFNATILNLENPLIFPNKPTSRSVVTADLNFGWLVLSYDYFKEGEQFVLGASYGGLIEPRSNGNVNLTLQKKFFGVNVSLAYTIRNILSGDEGELESDSNILLFNYFNQYREIVTLRVNL
ncbi:MAG: TonB-dependent receptor domain-containing protein, partial [Fidelibacterota bacterium]